MRRAVTRGIGAVALVAGALTASPADASEPVELKPEWGTISAENGVLKRGCRDYGYDYRITAPDRGDWDLNVTLVGPGGKELWFGYLYEGANPDEGTTTFRLCRAKTRPGRYKLKAVVSVQVHNEVTAGRLKTEKFRLRRAG
jgi:hypothetical protein